MGGLVWRILENNMDDYFLIRKNIRNFNWTDDCQNIHLGKNWFYLLDSINGTIIFIL